MNYKNYIPTYKEESVYKIDFLKYKELGYNKILCDLDNTIATYDMHSPSNHLKELIEKIKNLGFEFIIVSNSKRKRVYPFGDILKVSFISSAKKPLTLCKKKLDIDKHTLFIGDQMLTDILFSNKLGIDSILVDSMNVRNQLFYTKINRMREKRILKVIKKNEPEAYLKIVGEKNGL